MASRDDGLLHSEVGVGCELIEWIHPAVANSDSLQVEVMMRIPVHEVDDGRNVMTSIRFSCDEEFTTLELRISDKEVVHKNVEVESYIILVPLEFPVAIDSRETRSDWLI